MFSLITRECNWLFNGRLVCKKPNTLDPPELVRVSLDSGALLQWVAVLCLTVLGL